MADANIPETEDFIIPPSDEETSLPPVELQAAIAEAVHEGVWRTKEGRTVNQCLLYAGAAASLAYAFTGRPYMVRCGYICISKRRRRILLPDPRETVRTDIAAEHAWATTDRNGRTEVVDLSSRNYRDHARKRYEMKFDWSPDFVWSFEDEIPLKYRTMFVADPVLTELLCRDLYSKHKPALKTIFDFACERMRDKGFFLHPGAVLG